MRSLKEKLMTPSYEESKSNVFTLGMIILKTGLLQGMQGVYDYKAGTINNNKLSAYVAEFGRKHCPNISNILKMCLVMDGKERKNFVQLQEFMEHKRLYDMDLKDLGESEFFQDSLKASQMNS